MSGIVNGFLKTYMLAYFLPSLLFVSLNIFGLIPSVIKYKFIIDSDFITSFQHQIFIILGMSAFIGFAFMSSASTLIKLFEGYLFSKIFIFISFPLKKIQEFKRKRYIKRLISIEQNIKKTRSRNLKQALRLEAEEIKAVMLMNFSLDIDDILPTTFGNIFKAFENYPYARYNIDSVLLWPRLINVIPAKYTDRIEEANNSVTFLVVSCFLFLLLAIECFLIFHFNWCNKSNVFFIKILAFSSLIFSFMFYRISLRAALNFGEVVKSCFDLFRHDLIQSFGIKRQLNLDEEREFWQKLRRFILIGEGDPSTEFQVKHQMN